jgi:hypothetical protein
VCFACAIAWSKFTDLLVIRDGIKCNMYRSRLSWPTAVCIQCAVSKGIFSPMCVDDSKNIYTICAVDGIQHSEPDDPSRYDDMVERSRDASLERDKPRHRRLTSGGETKSSSESSSSKLHSIDGKAMESSTRLLASSKALMSNEPKPDLDRFNFFVQIMGFSLLRTCD